MSKKLSDNLFIHFFLLRTTVWGTTLSLLVGYSPLTERFAAGAGPKYQRPNIIIIMTDQMRAQAMGCAGNSQVHTPNLDKLANQGVYLANMIANNPVCCPARATILTGMYPHRHGMIINDLRLRERERSLAELLADHDYATGFVGKWHLDGGIRMPGYIPPGLRRQGFQFWAANECNHNHFDSIYFRDSCKPIPIKKFEPEVWTDEAVSFIRQNNDRPFFLWWACGPPHNPYGAPEQYEKLYDTAKLKMRPNWKEQTRWGSRLDIAKYYAAITAIDDQVGRFMRILDELGIAEDTILLFTSDHGDMLGSQDAVFKCKPWAESINVPGIIRYPRRIKAGQRRDLLISHVDFVPTLLSFCGISIPDNIQGRDLSEHLASRDGREPEAVLLQNFEPRPQTGVPAAWRGVRTKRYTYARLRDKPWVLYDLRKDPYELNNLVDDPSSAALLAKMDALLQQEMERVGDSWDTNMTECYRIYDKPFVYHPHDWFVK
ncbi:MAG: sulfatase [Planctomycetota bacterium]|nr:MAG: sulfatase [Planctomycetota bacterium]